MTTKQQLARDEMNRKRREYRKRTGNAETHRYEKTKKGFLMRKYRNMQSRVLGIQYKKAHLYKGLSLLPRHEFYNWAFACEMFYSLWDNWVASGYMRKLCPTVDRIDSTKGYELDNIRWITHSENSALGCQSKKRIHK